MDFGNSAADSSIFRGIYGGEFVKRVEMSHVSLYCAASFDGLSLGGEAGLLP